MIVDTSALIALMREEPQTSWIVPILSANFGALKMSTANYLEAAIDIELVSVSPHHARIAREAYRLYGKGNHRARLNFGDCFAYALARTTNEPLLFKGDDFSQTDIPAARAPQA